MSPVATNLILVLLISLPVSSQQTCDSFHGLKQVNYALAGYTFHSSKTDDSFSCAERCLDHNQCKSYNYALSGPQQGLCELNSAGKNAPTPLQYRPGFVFVQANLKQVGFDSVGIETHVHTDKSRLSQTSLT